MRRAAAIFVAGVTLLLPVATLYAHHSIVAEFDANKPLTLRGNVAKMEWTNPHFPS